MGVLDPAIRSLEPDVVRDGPRTAGEHREFVVHVVRPVELHVRIRMPQGTAWDGRGMVVAQIVTIDGERDAQALTSHDGGVRVVLPPDIEAAAVTGLRLRLRFRDGQRAYLPLQLGSGRRHDLGTVVLAAAPLLASGRLVDAVGAPFVPSGDSALSVRAAEPPDVSWHGGWTWLGEGRSELRGDAPAVRRFEIPAGLTPYDAEVMDSVRFAPGAVDVVVPMRRLAKLSMGFAHPVGEARYLDLVLEPLGNGPTVAPFPFPRIEAERSVYGFGWFAPGTWRVVARVQERREPIWTSGWIDLSAPGMHEPEELAAIALPDLRSARIRWVDGDGRSVPRERVRESVLYVRDAADPRLWHGRWFLGPATVLTFADESVDVVVHHPGSTPIVLRGVDADRDVQLEELPEGPPVAGGPVHRWRLSRPGLPDQLATGRPWPAAWFER